MEAKTIKIETKKFDKDMKPIEKVVRQEDGKDKD